MTKIDVLALGNAMVDVLASVDDAFIERLGMQRGAMTLIDENRAAEIQGQIADAVEMSGGSAGNTIAGLASFGGRGAYIGKVATDRMGDVFRADMEKLGVRYATSPVTSGAQTGRCLVMVTPDGERTMNTYLGAGLQLSPDDVDTELVSGAAITYLEGYMFDPPLAKKAFVKAAEIAHAAGRKIALTLSDSFCVERHRTDFLAFVEKNTDILFANEAEIMTLFQTDTLEDAVQTVAEKCDLTVITRGAKGSVVVGHGETVAVSATAVSRVIDTTGAGDQFAAGVLYGLSQGLPPQDCARLGAMAAAEVIGHMGPRPGVAYAGFLKKAA